MVHVSDGSNHGMEVVMEKWEQSGDINSWPWPMAECRGWGEEEEYSRMTLNFLSNWHAEACKTMAEMLGHRLEIRGKLGVPEFTVEL